MKDRNELQYVTLRGEKVKRLVDVREFPIYEVGILCVSLIEYENVNDPTPVRVISVPVMDIFIRERIYTPEYEALMINAAEAAEAQASANIEAQKSKSKSLTSKEMFG